MTICGSDQQKRQPDAFEGDALFHRTVPGARAPGGTRGARCSLSGWPARSGAAAALPRSTALSSASSAVLSPAQTASSSSSMMPRIWSKEPRRRPLELAVGSLRGHLHHRDVGARVRVVEALRPRQLGGCRRDRQVAGVLVPLGLDLGRGQEVQELRDALVFLVRLPGHHPQRGAADDGVLRRAADAVPIGQRADFEVELGFGVDAGVAGRGFGEQRAFAGAEVGAAFVAAAGIDELAVLRPLAHRRDVLDLRRAVEAPARCRVPAKAVVLRGERHVVLGREVLQMDPALPGGGQRAFDARRPSAVSSTLADLLPGRQVHVRIDARPPTARRC